MRNYDGRVFGILGTVILHLIAAIIFMSFQIKTLNKKTSEEIFFDFTPEPETEISRKKDELQPASVEKILKDDIEMLNIARNLADKSDQKINAADYIDKVKEELINSGKLSTDNFIDEKKNSDLKKEDANFVEATDATKTKEKEGPSESQKMAANYKGATRIYYDLKGRNHLYLPIPIYMCQGSGKVVLSLEVGQKGEVLKAEVIPGESTTTDPCLIETAETTALSSRFNPDANSPKIQKGTLTYIFVAQ